MANMGSTGTVNITHAMLEAAKQAISNYQETITGLNGELQSEIDGLIPGNFSGSAANGFKAFYETNIQPNVTDGLTKMLQALDGICDNVKSYIPGEEQGVDDQLGQGNQGAGAQA